MTDQALDILKLVLLALLYLFFARVLWAVWSEVRNPANVRGSGSPQFRATASANADPTLGAATEGRNTKPARGRGDRPARLTVLEPKERRGTVFAVSGFVTIGREPDNTIQILGDSYISSHHARVSVAGEHVVLDDLGSTNGTFLNGSRVIEQRSVHIGDRIQVGYTVLEAQ